MFAHHSLLKSAQIQSATTIYLLPENPAQPVIKCRRNGRCRCGCTKLRSPQQVWISERKSGGGRFHRTVSTISAWTRYILCRFGTYHDLAEDVNQNRISRTLLDVAVDLLESHDGQRLSDCKRLPSCSTWTLILTWYFSPISFSPVNILDSKVKVEWARFSLPSEQQDQARFRPGPSKKWTYVEGANVGANVNIRVEKHALIESSQEALCRRNIRSVHLREA